MSRTKSAFLGTISSQLYSIIALIISLFSVPIIVRHLNSEIYGLSIIIFQITGYLGMFDFGLGAGVERFLAGTREDNDENRTKVKRIISTAFIVYTFIAICIIIIGNIFAPYAAEIFHTPAKYLQSVRYIISVLSVVLGLQIILRSITGIFFAHQKQILFNTLSFVLNLSNTILTIIFVCLGYGLWSFAYCQIIVFILNAALSLYFLNKYYSYIRINIKDFDFPLIKEMFSYGFALFLIGIAVQIIFQTDRIIIGSFVSLTAVSIYSFTTKIPELSSQVLWKISDNSFPALVELSKKENAGSFMKISHDKIMLLTLSLTTTFFWVVILTSYPFIKLWVGEQYFPGLTFTVLVAYLYLIQLTFIHVTSICLNGFGIAGRISVMALVEAAINLSLSIYLVKIYGINGVIIATIIGGVLTSFWYVPYLSIKYFGGNIMSYLLPLLKPLVICSIFDGILYYLFRNIFHDINNWFLLVFYTIGISIVYIVPVFILNKSLLMELKSKIFPGK
jgi:O-antigen/teichoic acid export membrane protein